MPPTWLTFSIVRAPRISPVSAERLLIVAMIAGMPPALLGSFDIVAQIMLKA
jgi:hypothetical protein